MRAIKDILQRIRNDRAKMQGTWIGIDESHIVLNALEKSEHIEAENAELRERLECSIEFPCKIGDTIYYINPYRAQPKIDEFKVISLCKENFYGKMIFIDNGEFFFAGDKWLFFTYAEAEARLKELQGGER